MRQALITASAAIYVLAATGQLRAQGFTPQELDRMSQQRNDALSHRNPGPRPPQNGSQKEALHQPGGVWVCRSTDQYIPILAAPSPGASQIAISSGQVAAGANRGDYTSILVAEGKVGYVPKSAVRPYKNEFNPHAACTVAGIKPSGIVQFDVR